MSQSDIIKTLTELVEKQAVQISGLLVRVENLEQELSFYKNRKNSGNSHIPPSVNLVKRNQSLREQSDKKAGGQQGHEGSTLKFSTTPIMSLTIPLITAGFAVIQSCVMH